MALKEQLDKFNKQQVKCQSTLSSIASSRAGTSSSRPSIVPAAISQKPAAPVKFSNNTERLQHINSIRKGPVGAQIKRVIELLYEVCIPFLVLAKYMYHSLLIVDIFLLTRQAFTPEQINEACYVDMHSNKAVFDSLRNNPKVYYDGRRFSYKAKHDVKDRSQLLSLIKKYPAGIAAIDLKDAYPNVMEDLQALKASKHIWLLSNADSQEDIAYPNDFKGSIQVDDDFKSLFRDIDIPNDMLDVEKELLKIGLKPVMNTAQRRAAAQINGISNKPKQKKKKQEISKRTKLTNAHLPELFKNLNGSSSRN